MKHRNTLITRIIHTVLEAASGKLFIYLSGARVWIRVFTPPPNQMSAFDVGRTGVSGKKDRTSLRIGSFHPGHPETGSFQPLFNPGISGTECSDTSPSHKFTITCHSLFSETDLTGIILVLYFQQKVIGYRTTKRRLAGGATIVATHCIGDSHFEKNSKYAPAAIQLHI